VNPAGPGARSKRDGCCKALGIMTSAFRHLTQGQAPGAGEPHKLAPRGTVGSIPTPATIPHYAAKDAARSVKPMPMCWPGSLPGWGTNSSGQKITAVCHVANVKAGVRLSLSAPIRSVSKSGDCGGLKNRRGWIETSAEHHGPVVTE